MTTMNSMNMHTKFRVEARRRLTAAAAPALAAAVLAGCSGNADDSALLLDDEAELTGTPLQTERLQEFEYRGQQLTFDRVRNDLGPDGTTLDVEEAAAGYIAVEYRSEVGDLFDLLSAEYGALTSLEIFEAFAPPDLEPHPSIVAAHAGEALALGRDPNELAPRSIDSAALAVDKAIPAACDSRIFSDISPLTWQEQITRTIAIDEVDFFLCAGTPMVAGQATVPSGCEKFHPSRLLVAGLCNDTAANRVPHQFYIDNSIFQFPPPPLNSGGIAKKVLLPQVVPPGQAFAHRFIAVRSRNQADFFGGNTHVQKTGVGVP